MNNEKIRIKLDVTRIKEFLKIVRTFASDIDVITDRICLDAKSILGLYSIDMSQCMYTRIISNDISEVKRFMVAMEEFKV